MSGAAKRSAAMLSRRTILRTGAAAAALVVTGCSVDAPAPIPVPPPDELEPVLADHVALLSQYAAAVVALPELAARLDPLQANLAAHVDALAGALAIEPPSPEASTESTASNATTPTAPEMSTTLSALLAAETEVRARMLELVPTTSGQRAPLLGSIAAAHACHQVLLQ